MPTQTAANMIRASIGIALLTGASATAQALQQGATDWMSRLANPRFKSFVRASSDPQDLMVPPWFGNDDGFSGVNQCEAYRLTEGYNELAVLGHYEGRPGYVGSFFRNFWGGLAGISNLPWENTRGQFQVDGAPLYDLPLLNYFRNPTNPNGQVAPFDGNLTGARAGGHINFTPIVWEDSLKLRVFDNWFNNAARFHRLSGMLGTWDDVLEVPNKHDWEKAVAIAATTGGWPHVTPRVPQTTVLTIPPGGSQNIRVNGPGSILELTCTVGSPTDWDDLDARFTFDTAPTPQVDCPLRVLGAMVRQPFSAPVATSMMNNDGSSRITNYFPMPFKSDAELEFVNNSATATISLTVEYASATGNPPRPWGYYTVDYNQGITQTGVPFDGPLKTNSHGMVRYLGLETSINNIGNIPGRVTFMHIEGDLCVRINGNKGDDHIYAASETSIGHWGWYDSPSDVPFASDFSFHSGLMSRMITTELWETNRMMGSILAFDPIHFVDGIDMKLEHGVANMDNADYRFYTMMYVSPGAARTKLFELDVANTAEETLANASFHEAAPGYTLDHGFFRDTQYQTPTVSDDVRVIGNFYQFDVSDPAFVQFDAFCLGFRLDRDRIGDGGVAQADVFIDGYWAGLLHSPTSNQYFRWKEGGELEVEIPRSLTRNKTAFTVELRPRVGSLPVNLARTWLYGY